MAESIERYIALTSEDATLVVGGTAQAGAAVAGDAEVSLTFAVPENVPAADRRRKLVLWRVEVFRASGASATNYQPQVYNSTGAATTDYATKYLGASTAPGTRFDVSSIAAPMYTGTAGKVFFKVNGDAADTFHFAVWFKAVL